MAERSVAMPPSSSGTPRIGSPMSREALSSSSGAAQASLAALGGRGADHLLRELSDHVGEHLLVLTGREVEQPGVLGGGDPVALGRLPGTGELRPTVPAVRKPALVTR